MRAARSWFTIVTAPGVSAAEFFRYTSRWKKKPNIGSRNDRSIVPDQNAVTLGSRTTDQKTRTSWAQTDHPIPTRERVTRNTDNR